MSVTRDVHIVCLWSDVIQHILHTHSPNLDLAFWFSGHQVKLKLWRDVFQTSFIYLFKNLEHIFSLARDRLMAPKMLTEYHYYCSPNYTLQRFYGFWIHLKDFESDVHYEFPIWIGSKAWRKMAPMITPLFSSLEMAGERAICLVEEPVCIQGVYMESLNGANTPSSSNLKLEKWLIPPFPFAAILI